MSKIVQIAKSYIGTRWLLHGRARSGVDCLGLLIVILKALNHPSHEGVAKYRIYPEISEGTFIPDHLALFFESIPVGEQKTGDILVLRIRNKICHIGIYEVAEDQAGVKHRPMMIHADTRRGVVYHGLGFWESKITHVFRINTKQGLDI